MKIRFDEQIYKKKSKIYWHGSRYPEYDPDYAYWNMFYVTQDLKYALEFSRNNPRDKWGYLYQCHIIDNLDIFNAKDSMDRVKLKRWLVSMEHMSEKYVDSVLDVLARKDWLTTLKPGMRDKFLNIIRTIGYDGFFNFEESEFSGADDNPSIGVFNPELIQIDQVYSGDEIEDIIQKFPKYKKEQERQIEEYLKGNTLWDTSLINDLSSLRGKTFEDYIKDKENQFRTMEEAYKNDKSWYIQRRLSMYRESLSRLKERFNQYG